MKEIIRSAGTRHDGSHSEEDRYEDIIDLPHHVSQSHPQMSLHDRAAQFSPFAALTGHGAAIRETERLTQERIELDENSKRLLDDKLRILQEEANRHPEITVTYFKPDQKKAGGAYVEVRGNLKRIHEAERMIILCDGEVIPMDEVIEIERGV